MAIIAPEVDRLHLAQEAEQRIRDAAGPAEPLRAVFQELYGRLGWRALCRMWVLGQAAEKALRLE